MEYTEAEAEELKRNAEVGDILFPEQSRLGSITPALYLKRAHCQFPLQVHFCLFGSRQMVFPISCPLLLLS